MSIKIDAQRCIGCGRCTEVCPGMLLQLCGGKAEIPSPERCWGCASCLKECSVQAILMYLGEDMGGLGGRISIRREKTLLHWSISKPDGTQETITVDSRNSNQY